MASVARATGARIGTQVRRRERKRERGRQLVDGKRVWVEEGACGDWALSNRRYPAVAWCVARERRWGRGGPTQLVA